MRRATLLIVGLVEAIALPAFALFFNVPILPILGPLVLVIALATVGFVAVGTLLSSMAVNTRLAELLLPLMLLPFLVPPVMAAAQITARLFNGRPFSEVMGWLRLLVAYDVVFVKACILVFEFTIEE